MTALPFIDVVGFWLGIFLTFCILSFLYKDNPFYKLAEHLFIGVSIGYIIVLQYNDNLDPKLVDAVIEKEGWALLLRLIAVVLVVMLFMKALSRRFSWVGRYPLAFVVAFFAGLQVNAVAQAELGAQIKFSARSLDAEKTDLNTATPGDLTKLPGMSPLIAEKLVAERGQRPFTSVDDAIARPSLTPAEQAGLADERGHLIGLDARAAVGKDHRNWFGVFSNVLLLLGLLASLVYFYFSVAHTGAVGRVSRVGVWVLMIGFGASFGLTVQGRLSLAIGRAYSVLGRTVNPADAEQIKGPYVALISIVIIGLGLAGWELRRRRAGGDEGGPGAAGAGGAGAASQT
ncbi:MAG: helix-hairpin-helix domain-containing protein [Kofleriaceae bacterium]|nr:helix-hairpin-helix domain-containing protein [Kofleriaceae bacterium]MCL4224765.1 helix-hairpin-helix domain-containing protein [Myxococcales bacterium]